MKTDNPLSGFPWPVRAVAYVGLPGALLFVLLLNPREARVEAPVAPLLSQLVTKSEQQEESIRKLIALMQFICSNTAKTASRDDSVCFR